MIRHTILFDNKCGFVLGENPKAPNPYVTWQFNEQDGHRDFFWGHYHNEPDMAERDFHNRAEDYQRRYHVFEVEQAPDKETYKYYSTQRPIGIGTYPNSYFNRPVHMDLYFTRQEVTGEGYKIVKDGKDIKLTIDADLQAQLYKNFKSDKSCSIAMNPFTGEVLAMVSTPSYDTNAFIMGMSKKQWDRLNKDKKQPLYNRFRQVWCPGSTFKPVIAAIGLQSEAFTGTDNFGNEGHSWQKDKTWGTYHVTTLHTYSPVILKNALIYSDNIYFAKAALKIGTEEMERSLSMLGFHSSIPFEIMMAESKFSNNKHIQSEVGLADTGYGQGQVLVNPLHLACIYTSFCNDGNVLKPYLLYKENAKAEQWISEAFSKSVSQEVLEGIKSVVNDSHGTGYAIHRKDMILAGKTGTAEIKESQSDTTGTELGWFAVMTPDKKNKKPILIVSMVEDVKGIGGSGYVVKKDKAVLDKWFGKN